MRLVGPEVNLGCPHCAYRLDLLSDFDFPRIQQRNLFSVPCLVATLWLWELAALELLSFDQLRQPITTLYKTSQMEISTFGPWAAFELSPAFTLSVFLPLYFPIPLLPSLLFGSFGGIKMRGRVCLLGSRCSKNTLQVCVSSAADGVRSMASLLSFVVWFNAVSRPQIFSFYSQRSLFA